MEDSTASKQRNLTNTPISVEQKKAVYFFGDKKLEATLVALNSDRQGSRDPRCAPLHKVRGRGDPDKHECINTSGCRDVWNDDVFAKGEC